VIFREYGPFVPAFDMTEGTGAYDLAHGHGKERPSLRRGVMFFDKAIYFF